MNVLVHDHTQDRLAGILSTRTGSYIFHGLRSIGKATSAREVSRLLNCMGDQPAQCTPCRQLEAGNYPDYLVVKPEDKPSILIEQVRSLIQALSLSVYRPGGLRVVVIDEAGTMTTEAQNALLKLIEEPPAHTIFILVTEQLTALLPTVRSRCAQIYFAPVPADAIAARLTSRHGIPGPQAAIAAAAAGGAPGLAITLADHPDEARARLELEQLAAGTPALGVFQRLLLAARLSSTKADLGRFGAALHAGLVSALRAGEGDPQVTSRQLAAVARFREQLQAKVAPRVAVERLMLEL